MKRKKVVIILFFCFFAIFAFNKKKVLDENIGYECKGVIITKCVYALKYISNDETIEVIEKYKYHLLYKEEKREVYYYGLTKNKAKKLSENPHVKFLGKEKLVEALEP